MTRLDQPHSNYILKNLFFMIRKLPLYIFNCMYYGRAAAYYTLVGDDLMGAIAANPASEKKSFWYNIGYWQKAKTYPEACADLARYLANAAMLSAEDEILDVGFGYAEQDILWVKENNVKKITGINNTKIQVDKAKQLVRSHNLSDRIELQVGTATKLPFPDNTFSKVLALDCAIHFNTREKFLEEAFRVLKPGGLLGITDICQLAGSHSKINKFYRWQVSQFLYFPLANFYDNDTYQKKLKLIGFQDIKCTSIRNYIFPGAAKYLQQRNEGKKMEEAEINLSEEEIANCVGIDTWSKLGLEDYAVFTARK